MPLIRLQATGYNAAGRLGTGDTTQRVVLDTTQLFALMIDVRCGYRHAIALRADGTVWAWGYNGTGQLGDGTTVAKYTPVQVSGLSNIVAIAAGSFHNLALDVNGNVWAWGAGFGGALGNGSTANQTIPVQVSGLTNVQAIAASASHSLALLNDGTVKAWGYNAYGQVGDGTTTPRLTPVAVEGLSGIAAVFAGGGSVISSTDSNNGGCSFAIDRAGNLWGWGKNLDGELGDGTTTDRHVPTAITALAGVTQVAGNGIISPERAHTLFLLSDGTVWATGYNGLGQLGDGTTLNKVTPIQVPGISGVTQIAAGHAHSLAITQDGKVRAWGYNNTGQLGDNSTVTRTSPVLMHKSDEATGISGGEGFSLVLFGKQALLFADSAGKQLDVHALGQVLGGATLGPVGIDLYNGTGITVQSVQVTKQNLPPFPDPNGIEISDTQSPFTPQDPLLFSGQHAPEALIGTVWVRAQTQVKDLEGKTNQGDKEFDLSGTSQPV